MALVALLILNYTVAVAQSTPRPDQEKAASSTEEKAKPKTFSEIWHEGGWVMYPLAIASILTVTLTAEGFHKLRIAKLAPPAMVAKIKELVAESNYQEAWILCRDNPCFFSNVIRIGLERIGKGKDAVENIMQEVSIKEATLMKTHNRYLSVIGVVTPMIGLTGTVVGMVKAFAVLGSTGIADPAALAAKISEVLIATAGGLVVAIPAFIIYYVLGNRAQSVLIEADSIVNRILEDVPYEELQGLKIGENFTLGQAGSVGNASRAVSVALTTNCPQCNAPIQTGESPCPNCGAVLSWTE
jgi:biopolymer transport protein ExbB